jgi:FkbM family methyltransferase
MTLQFAVLVPKGHVFSFEPYPPNFYLLNKNIEDNKFTHISIFNRAVSDTDIDLCFATKINKNMGDIRLKADTTTTCKANEIHVGSMSTADISTPRLDLMKIDVQGYELRVLKTSEGLIMKHRPYIIIEFEEWNLKRLKCTTPELVKYIRDTLNYEVFMIAYDYPSDHIIVPREKLEDFRRRFRGHFFPLVKPNHINTNFEAGVKEVLCLRGVDCPDFFKNATEGMMRAGP